MCTKQEKENPAVMNESEWKSLWMGASSWKKKKILWRESLIWKCEFASRKYEIQNESASRSAISELLGCVIWIRSKLYEEYYQTITRRWHLSNTDRASRWYEILSLCTHEEQFISPKNGILTVSLQSCSTWNIFDGKIV